MAVPSTQSAVLLSKFTYNAATPLPEVLSLAKDHPVPTPNAGQVLVKMTLRPINPADMLSLVGFYPGFKPASFPAVPGSEGCGVVAALGPGVTSVAVGQRVTSLGWASGTWQEYVLASEAAVVVVPDAVPDEFAAAAMVNPLSVVGMMDAAAVPSGEALLITAAGSALNRLVLQLAKHRGTRVIGVVRRAEQKEAILAAGASDVVVSADGSGLAEAVMALTGGKGAWAAMDSIAGPAFSELCKAVRVGGTVLLYGAQGGVTASLDVVAVIFRATEVKGFYLSAYLGTLGPAKAKALFAEVLELCEKGIFQPLVGESFALADFMQALDKQNVVGRDGKMYLSS